MVNWTPDLISKFLLTTLQQISPQISRDTWTKVADVMGDDISAEACRQKYAKLLASAGIESVPATPGPATPVKATPKSGGRKRKDATGIEATTPSKRASAKKQKKVQLPDILQAEDGNGMKIEGNVEQEELVVPPTPYKKPVKSAFADDSD